MLKTICLLSAGVAIGALTPVAPSDTTANSRLETPEQILEAFVADFRTDPQARTPRTFAVRVSGDNGGTWTIESAGAKGEAPAEVTLRRGEPKQPTFAYVVDADTLARIGAGELNALTAQGKAFAGDWTPMSVEWMDGAEEYDERPFSFHFWTRGLPEKVPFGQGLTREVHGADNVVFYYQKGFRSAWTRLEKGRRADNGPGRPMVVPFPMMVVSIKGCANGKVGGREVTAKAGEMVFIPPMTAHQWWNEGDEPAEAILLMFGDGA